MEKSQPNFETKIEHDKEDLETSWCSISNLEENEDKSSNVCYETNMAARSFCRSCKEKGIPVFLSYYLPGKGYKYSAEFPEEIGTPEVKSEYGKFKEFLRVCIGFNKKDYFPQIH